MEDDDELTFVVLMNEEEQYSLWPLIKEVPEGWTQVGPTGTREECIAYVDEHWTDMTPKSRRA